MFKNNIFNFGAGSLAQQEARLAFWMLAPTFFIVFAIVLFPVFANFWISFKSIELSDLRAPQPVVQERIRQTPEAAGDTIRVRYQMRNSSREVTVSSIAMTDIIPQGLELQTPDERCSLVAQKLSCDFGNWEGGYRENLELDFITTQAFFDSASDPLDSEVRISGKAPNKLTNFDFSLENFRRVFRTSEFWSVLRVSLWYTIFGTLGSIVLGLFAAQLLNENFPGKGLLRGLFLFPYVAPVIAAAFTWSFMLDPLSGTVNALAINYNWYEQPINYLSQRYFEFQALGTSFKFPLALSMVILFEAWRYFPFAFLFILARFQAIPSEMYEAADVDGASPLQKFWHITMPQLIGILSTLFLLRFIWTFNKFDDIFLLTGGAAGTKTLTVEVYDQAFARSDLGAGAAVAVVLFLVLAIFMVIYFRYAPDGE